MASVKMGALPSLRKQQLLSELSVQRPLSPLNSGIGGWANGEYQHWTQAGLP